MNAHVKLSKAELFRLYARSLDAFELTGAKPPPVRLFDIEALELIYSPPKVIRSQDDFRPYQRWMANQMVRQPAVFIAAEMGLGKTGATLWAIRRLLDLGEVKRVLVVAPLKVADLTWPKEIATWKFARSLTYSVLTGTEDERLIALRQKADIHIINRENFNWLQQTIGVRHWPYDMLVYDEASRLKSGDKKTKGNVRKDGTKSIKRTSHFGMLARMRYAFKHVVLLSGTPSPNGLIDLWGPMYIIDLGQRLGTSYDKYKGRWFEENQYDYSIKPYEWSEEEIMSRIRDVFHALKEEDYLTLPPIVSVDHWIDLPPKAMEQYRRMEKTMVLSEFDVEAVNNGVLTNKLLQIANGSIYDEDRKDHKLHDAKLDVLDSIVSEAAGRPILLGYQFQFDKRAIKERFPFARFFGDSKNDMDDWDAGNVRLMVCHPASAGHGLNFQGGGNILVWYGLTWSLELYLQFRKRLHRSGQMADRVFFHRILARDTADEAMVGVLDQKGVTQDRITSIVRAHVEEDLKWQK